MSLDQEMAPLHFSKLSSTNLNYLSVQSSVNIDDNSNNNNINMSMDPQLLPSPHICASCEKPILDEFLSSVLNKWWHESCLKCAECGSQLADTCYSREGKTFCREDFYR